MERPSSQLTSRSAIRSLETVPAGKIAPRRGNVHDVGRTITHERITCRTVLRGSWQAAGAEGTVRAAERQTSGGITTTTCRVLCGGCWGTGSPTTMAAPTYGTSEGVGTG